MNVLGAHPASARSDLAALTEEIERLREPSLPVCVDHEGGRVQRFREGFTLPTVCVSVDNVPSRRAVQALLPGHEREAIAQLQHKLLQVRYQGRFQVTLVVGGFALEAQKLQHHGVFDDGTGFRGRLLLAGHGNRKFHIRTYVACVGSLDVYVYRARTEL